MAHHTYDANGNVFSRITSSPTSAVTVTPSDTADLPKGATQWIFISTAGTLKVDMADGTTVTFPAGLPANVFHRISVKRIYATGTAATGIIALY